MKYRLIKNDVEHTYRLKYDELYKKYVRNAEFSEGNKVDTPDGLGVVTGVWEQTWEDDGEEVDASSDSPAYTVALIDGGFGHYPESDVSEAGDEWPDPDVDDPASDLADAAEAAAENSLAKQGITDWDYPESWDESERPNRVILLDAWSSMRGQFDCAGGGCCKGTMRQAGMGERASDQFCASMKDRVLGTEAWRGWGPD